MPGKPGAAGDKGPQGEPGIQGAPGLPVSDSYVQCTILDNSIVLL